MHKRNKIYLSKPGITGIGSVIFRNDEEKWISDFKGDRFLFYRKKISPYKTDLEQWYLKNKSIIVDFNYFVNCLGSFISQIKNYFKYY